MGVSGDDVRSLRTDYGGMNVLLVGRIEPSLATAVQAKYKALLLPNDATRTAFLAKHGASIIAIVDGGPPGVDADLMKALPNLGAIVHQGAGYDTIDVDAARRLGIGVSNTPTCSTTLLPTQQLV